MRKYFGGGQKKECPFCGELAISANKQKIPVCKAHKDRELLDLKCACGGWLDLKFSKWGPFFTCMDCGTVSFKKALDMNGYPLKSIKDL